MPLFFMIGGFLLKPINDSRKWLVSVIDKYVVYIVVWYFAIGWFAVFKWYVVIVAYLWTQPDRFLATP